MRRAILLAAVAALSGSGVVLSGSVAVADPGYNPATYFCNLYSSNTGYPHASGSRTVSSGTLLGTSYPNLGGGSADGNWSSTPSGSVHADSTAQGGNQAPVDDGFGLMSVTMGNGTADTSAVRQMLTCSWNGSSYFSDGHASTTVTISSQSATGSTYLDYQSGVHAASWIDVSAYFYPVECAFAGWDQWGDSYYSCSIDYNDWGYASQRVACWPPKPTCSGATSISLSATVPSNGCTPGSWDGSSPIVYCTGVYAVAGIYSHSDATGDKTVTASSSATGTVGDIGP